MGLKQRKAEEAKAAKASVDAARAVRQRDYEDFKGGVAPIMSKWAFRAAMVAMVWLVPRLAVYARARYYEGQAPGAAS